MKTKQTKQTILASDEELKVLTPYEELKRLEDYEKSTWQNYAYILLRDMTRCHKSVSSKHIRFCTDNYQEYGYGPDDEVTPEAVLKINILPRVAKSKELQKARSKAKAEVFTPSWICNEMNNHCDTEWFGYKDVFNVENDDHTWKPTDKVIFPEGKTWQEYVALTRLEMCCGEAPFMVSRYDTTTGLMIPIEERIGFLDRKLRVINENYDKDGGIREWYKWVKKAYQTSYGFEWSGDNLLLARLNLMMTYLDYGQMWQNEEDKEYFAKTIFTIADIISWNVFQMDGLKDTLPHTDIPAKIRDWEKSEVIEFRSIKKQEG